MTKKIKLDKYYTPDDIVDLCLNLLKEQNFNITEYIEPSAGNGAFSLKLKDCIAYDILPEHPSILKQDFLELSIPYKKGRCVIGNPPFGRCNQLSRKFFNKAVEIADYIAFIQPISQYNNNNLLYKFDLISSTILPETLYSGILLKCVFNIYKRPKKGLNSSPKTHPFRDIHISTVCRTLLRNNKIKGVPCYSLNAWGDLNKRPSFKNEFAFEIYISCFNKQLESKIIEICENTNWFDLCDNISMPKLQSWRIYKYLKEKLPELK